ncbi:phosphoglycerate kinase [Candidatus Gottesmanbacteria bacterium]|nr:phosphoglycerate kinase [Candidatus Gottesmanbacteria bacterium]
MKKKTIRDIPKLSGKTVFVRVDFNVSLNNGEIANDARIKEVLPTIKYLIEKGAKVILASHLGRPKGKFDPKYSMRPVAEWTEKLLGTKVTLLEKYWEPQALIEIEKAKENSVIMLDNIRFHKGEETNDIRFGKHLAKMADVYVNDAFGSSHRAHASIVGISQFLPPYAGFLLDKEITMISKAIENPEKPMVVVIGGAKTPEKIRAIEKLIDIGDTVLLGGAIANTFLAAWGFGMGRSIVDHEMVEMARVLFWKTAQKHTALILPLDVIVSDSERIKKPKILPYNEVSNDAVIYDIGPETCKKYKEVMREAKTIIWNGPMGLFEDPRFANGTECILKTMAECKNATTIIGGGDTLTSIKNANYLKNLSHVSTGGGAMLEFLEKGTLPGIEVLQDA